MKIIFMFIPCMKLFLQRKKRINVCPSLASRTSMGTSDEGLDCAKTSKEKKSRRKKEKITPPVSSLN